MFLDNWKNSKFSENIKSMLTNDWTCDKVIQSLKQNDRYQLLEKVWKNLKKFLTNKRRYDKLNKLSRDSEKQWTLITKQWNTYDSRKFFYTTITWRSEAEFSESAVRFLKTELHCLSEWTLKQ